MNRLTLPSILSFFFLFSIHLSGQSFEGIVRYEIQHHEAIPNGKNAALKPTNLTFKAKGKRSKMIEENGLGNIIVLADESNQEITLLMNMFGNHVGYKSDMEAANDEVSIEYLEETKTVLNYPCKKAVIKDKKGNQLSVYYTNKIDAKTGKKEFTDLKGFPLMFEQLDEWGKSTVTATEVHPATIMETEFEIPHEYHLMSEAEFNAIKEGY